MVRSSINLPNIQPTHPHHWLVKIPQYSFQCNFDCLHHLDGHWGREILAKLEVFVFACVLRLSVLVHKPGFFATLREEQELRFLNVRIPLDEYLTNLFVRGKIPIANWIGTFYEMIGEFSGEYIWLFTTGSPHDSHKLELTPNWNSFPWVERKCWNSIPRL